VKHFNEFLTTVVLVKRDRENRVSDGLDGLFAQAQEIVHARDDWMRERRACRRVCHIDDDIHSLMSTLAIDQFDGFEPRGSAVRL
jgi:hypothetical protein